MAVENADMDELDDRDRAVLQVLARGRANPYLIREETELEKGDTNTVLVRLGRAGYVEQVTRGLYEITTKGRDEVGAETTLDAVRDDLARALTRREWNAVEDAAARLGVDV